MAVMNNYLYLKCDTCTRFYAPRKLLVYTIDPDPEGWRVCGVGNVISKTATACHLHDMIDPLTTPETKVTPSVKEFNPFEIEFNPFD